MLILSFICGVVLWSFTEYMLHRFLGHVHKGKNFFKAEHSLHHQRANYFAPPAKKIIAAVAVSAIAVFGLSFLFSWSIAISFVLGLMGMYGLYEITHARYHKKGPLLRPFIILRKHHFYHHFHNPKMNHGVTTRFWDRVFGSFHPVETVRVPKKMKMDWLMLGDAVKPEFCEHFFVK